MTLNQGFGKYKHLTFQEVADEDYEYCSWILSQDATVNMRMLKLQGFLRNLAKLKEQQSSLLKDRVVCFSWP